MNHQILHDFIQRIRQNVETLSIEVSRSQIDTKEALGKIKQTRYDLTQLYNLLKIEESLSNANA